MEILSAAASLGVGAFLGTLIFIIYRIDRRASEQRFERLCQHHDKKWATLVQADQKTREDNTKALTKLTDILSKMNGAKG